MVTALMLFAGSAQAAEATGDPPGLNLNITLDAGVSFTCSVLSSNSFTNTGAGAQNETATLPGGVNWQTDFDQLDMHGRFDGGTNDWFVNVDVNIVCSFPAGASIVRVEGVDTSVSTGYQSFYTTAHGPTTTPNMLTAVTTNMYDASTGATDALFTTGLDYSLGVRANDSAVANGSGEMTLTFVATP
jgi:hypothetical protein